MTAHLCEYRHYGTFWDLRLQSVFHVALLPKPCIDVPIWQFCWLFDKDAGVQKLQQPRKLRTEKQHKQIASNAAKKLCSNRGIIGMLQSPPLIQSRSQSTSLVECPALHKHLQPSAGSCMPIESEFDCGLHPHKIGQTLHFPTLGMEKCRRVQNRIV